MRLFRCQQKVQTNVLQIPDGRAGDGVPDFQVYRAEQETADVGRAEPDRAADKDMVPEQADEGEEMPQGSAADRRRPAHASAAGRGMSAGGIGCRLCRRLLQQRRRAGR